MGIEKRLAFRGAETARKSKALSGFENAQGILNLNFHYWRRDSIIAEDEYPAKRGAFDVFCWALDPIRIKKSVGIFGGFVAIRRAAVKTAVVYTKTFGILAVFLEGNHVFAFTGVEKRS